MKVLICDDEPLAVERLSRLVSKMGHEVLQQLIMAKMCFNIWYGFINQM
jgi:DNA-binding LytR/AlgR family response regulator